MKYLNKKNYAPLKRFGTTKDHIVAVAGRAENAHLRVSLNVFAQPSESDELSLGDMVQINLIKLINKCALCRVSMCTCGHFVGLISMFLDLI